MPEDVNTPTPNIPQGNSSGAKVTKEPSLSMTREKVIQPTEAILNEVKAQQAADALKPQTPVFTPTHPTPGMPMPITPDVAAQVVQSPVQPQQQPQISRNQMPVGVAASALGLNSPRRSWIKWGSLLKGLIVIVVLLGLAGGGLYAKNLLSKVNTKTLNNDGYTYTYKYYKDAYPVNLTGGKHAYKYQNSSTSGADITNVPLVNDCSQIGSSWSEAFNVKVYGSEEPVCTASSNNLQDYTLIFSALGKNHLFVVTYNNDEQLSSDTSTLKTIFGSVKVSQ